MAIDQILADRVRVALGQVRVDARRMFGGITFMVEGKMCISVGTGRIMCRIDPAIHEDAPRQSGCRKVLMNGREYRGYVYVDSEAVRSEDKLRYWVDLALDYNRRAEAAGRSRRGAERRRAAASKSKRQASPA